MMCVCAVIGRGGEQINKIQQDSGCKVQIAPGESRTASEESASLLFSCMRCDGTCCVLCV